MEVGGFQRLMVAVLGVDAEIDKAALL